MDFTPFVSYGLLAVIGLTSYQAFNNQSLLNKCMFNAYQIVHRKEWYRIFTHGFIHSGWPHLILNALVLFFFGPNLEATFSAMFGATAGHVTFGMLFFSALIVSSIPALVKHKDNHYYNALGASGAVYAVLFAHVMIYPVNYLYLYGIVKIPGYLVAIGVVIWERYSAKNRQTNIGHEAHLTGGLYGLLFVILLNPALVVSFVEQIISHPLGMDF